MKKLHNSQKGFTIIEVMIVLVIAAVILLIVFLAVPALQRNSRNTQRKNDVANLLAGIAEYAANHNGQLPGSSEFTDDVLPNVNFGFYEAADVEWMQAPELTNGAITAENDTLYVNPYSKCDGNNVEAASARQYSAVFNLERASGLDQPQCQAG